MKKVFASFVAGMFLLTGVAFACEGSGCYTDAYPKNHVFSGDNSYVDSYKGSYSNTGKQDEAGAWADGGAASSYGADSGSSSKFAINGASGFENAGSDSAAGTYAFDFGLTSGAGGFAAQDSFSNGGAIAGGLGFGKGTAWAQTGGTIGGQVHQGNSANEGFGPTGAFAGNQSNAGYYAGANDAACYSGFGVWGAAAGHDLTGSAFVKGDSFVTVDPFGNHQSAYGKTSNMAKTDVKGADYENTYVNGRGGVDTSAGVGDGWNGAKSWGHSGFMYDATKFGAGSAEHYSYASKDSNGLTNSSRAGSTGSAFTVTFGGTSQPQN